MTDEDRARLLDERRSKRDLELGKGGEGYIAEDEWCYNCGEVGHWGDVRYSCNFISFLYLIAFRTVKPLINGINQQNLPPSVFIAFRLGPSMTLNSLVRPQGPRGD